MDACPTVYNLFLRSACVRSLAVFPPRARSARGGAADNTVLHAPPRRARADFSPLRAGCRWGRAAPDSQHQHPLSATHAQASPGRQLLVMRQAVRNNVRRTPHSDAPVHASDAP